MREEKKKENRGGSRGGGRPKTFRKVCTITLTDPAKQLLDDLAKELATSKSDVVERALYYFLENK